MPLIRRPNGVIEVRTAQFRCRLQPLGQEEGYRVLLFHHKPNRFTDSRLIFHVCDPQELGILLKVIQAAIAGTASHHADAL